MDTQSLKLVQQVESCDCHFGLWDRSAKTLRVQQTKLPSLKAFPGLFVLDEEAITPRISNTALNCYVSPSPSPNPNPSPSPAPIMV